MMRKALVAAILFLSIKSLLFAEYYDFRHVRWGMSREQVKNIEGAPEAEYKGALFYKEVIANRDYYLLYIFVKNKLVRAVYLLNEKYYTYKQYLDIFDELLALLSQKYGEPHTNKLIITDYNSFIDGNVAISIAMGAAYKVAQWMNEKTIITLLAKGDNKLGLVVEIEYASIELAPLEEQEQLNENKSKI